MKKRCMPCLTKVVLFFLLVLLYHSPMMGYAQSAVDQPTDTRMDWWRAARFGLFIHWGLYAIPAGEWNDKTIYGEWVRHSAQIPLVVYDTFQQAFNPDQFNARQWVAMAKDAGMKYIVITTKHHDGFCLFETARTPFNVMETPFGRDVMKGLAEACREEGIVLCFYYSIMDWHHPDYLPKRGWESLQGSEKASFKRYVRYLKHQIKELLTHYGDIGVLWFDGEWESTWNETYGKEIYRYARRLQPGIIINNRVGAGRLDMKGLTRDGAFGGDFGTPEQQVPPTGTPGVDWETCLTMNDNWGFNKVDTNFKSTGELIRVLTDIASKGGNLLLNVGPQPNGEFPAVAVERLQQIGEWMKVNGESIYGTQASPFDATPWGRCTMKQDADDQVTLYLHLYSWPSDGYLRLRGCLNEPVNACFLNNPTLSLETSREEDAILISLPTSSSTQANLVIRLTVRGLLDITRPPTIIAENDFFIDRMKVEIVSDQPHVEIRFSADGTDPTDSSFLYVEPLEIRGAITLKARCFRDGKPVSGTVTRFLTNVIPLAAKAVSEPKPGLRYRLFEGEWDHIPDFDTLPPVSWGVLKEITIEKVKQQENFGIRFTGYIQVPEKAVYTFFIDSDDGSALYIGSRKVVDNDGLHGLREKSGSIGLAKGFHRLTVTYFERTGSDDLNVSIQSPAMKKQPLPGEWLFH